MKISSNIILSIVLLASSSQVYCQYGDTIISGKQLYKFCSSNIKAENSTCAGYIGGVIDTMVALNKSEVLNPLICLPLDVKLHSVKDVVVEYLEKHPEEHNLNASSVVLGPIINAYPCGS